MASANAERVLRRVYAVLGRPSPQVLPYQDVHFARVEAGAEILRAVAANPKSGFFASLATLVTVAHNAFLPAHDGGPGVPLIVPFSGAPAREGLPADPDQIDSWRGDGGNYSIYSGASDGVAVPHDQPDADGRMSPLACRYSIVGGRLKFTGLSAQVPLVQLTRTMADSGVPDSFEPTLVKLVAARLSPRLGEHLREYPGLAARFEQLALADLEMIRRGETVVPPVPDVVTSQKAAI